MTTTNTTRNPLDFEMTLAIACDSMPLYFIRGENLSGTPVNWGPTRGVYITVWQDADGYGFTVRNSVVAGDLPRSASVPIIACGRVQSPVPQDLYEAARAAFAQMLAGWDEDNSPSIEERANEYCDLLTEVNDSIWKGRCPANEYDFKLKKGRRFWKVMGSLRSNDKSFCVHAFVEIATGDVYKPASWSAAAKGVRYRLMDDESRERMYATLRANSKHGTIHCGYLYC